MDDVDAPAPDWAGLGEVLNAGWRALAETPVAAQLARFSDPDGEKKHGLGLLRRSGAPAVVHAYKGGGPTLGRVGDLLLGFAALERDVPAFEMVVGGRRHPGLAVPALRRGEWRAALGGEYPIPLICMSMAEVRVHPPGLRDDPPGARSDAVHLPDGCWAVYAHIGEAQRRAVREGVHVAPVESGGSWMFGSGLGCVVDCVPEGMRRVVSPLPALSLEPPLAERLERARRRMDALREDLARAAWHPSRLRSWCLPHDDPFAQQRGPPLWNPSLGASDVSCEFQTGLAHSFDPHPLL